MFINAFTDQSRSSRPKGGRKRLNFTYDFVVAERPIYIPGSGPPLAPVTVMPAHDKDGIIEGMTRIDKKPMYIVIYEEHPYLRVSVKPQNILDWVSPRTLEDWEFARTQEEEKEFRDAEAAKKQRQRLKEKGVAVKASRGKEASQGTSRKRKRTLSPERASGMGMSTIRPPSSSGRRRKQKDEEEEQEAVYTSPQRPSLSIPVKQRGLADVMDYESDEEDPLQKDTAALISRQLNGTQAPRSKLANEITWSATVSPEPQPLKIQKLKKPSVPQLDRRETRSRSASSTPDVRRRETRSSSASGPSHRDSVAASSSREARAIYEKLERKAEAGSITEKYSYLGKRPSKPTQHAASSYQKSAPPQRKKSATPKPAEDDESEYEVDDILADEYRIDKKGKHALWYLIKWVGEWPNSWEPVENIGSDAIAEYKEKKRLKQEKIDRAMMGLDGASGDDTMDVDLRDKGKKKIPFGAGSLRVGSGKKGTIEDEGDEDTLFVKDSSRGPDTDVEMRGLKKVLVPVPKPKRGEVIDDEASYSDDF